MLDQNSNGSVDILDDRGFVTYTVDKNETGLVAILTKELLKYEQLFKYGALEDVLSKYFDVPNDTYAYNLTRVKEAFSVGTMTLDDFEEFDEETINDLAAFIRKELE